VKFLGACLAPPHICILEELALVRAAWRCFLCIDFSERPSVLPVFPFASFSHCDPAQLHLPTIHNTQRTTHQGGSLHARLYGPSRSSSGGAALAALAASSVSGASAAILSSSGSGPPAVPRSSSGLQSQSSSGVSSRRSRHGAPAPLPLWEALVIAADVASAMIYLHTASDDKPVVVHRDLVRWLLLGGGLCQRCLVDFVQ